MCPIGKAQQKNLNKTAGRKSKKPGQVFASDISSVATEAIGGRRYWLLVVDQYTSMKWNFFLRTKDEQPKVLTNFVQKMSHMVKIERWKFDNAGENKSTQTMFEEKGFGINCEFTSRETPQQNGKVEQAFAILFGRVRALMTNAGFEKVKREVLWAECAATATKLDNLLVKTNERKTHMSHFMENQIQLKNTLGSLAKLV